MGVSQTVKATPLRDFASFYIGGGWGKDDPASGRAKVAVIRGTDIPRLTQGDYSGLPIRYESYRKVESRSLKEGDIVIEIAGGSAGRGQSTGRSLLITRGLLNQFNHPVIPASFCKLLRLDETLVDPKFVYYFLQEMYSSKRVSNYEQQSTGISNFQFELFLDSELVPEKTLPEQRRIAHILGTLDDKIELNRRMNATLEAIARALFKSWFVDFDPVRAKAAGRPSGLPPALDALFPSRFMDSELGEIPEGWEVKGLDQIADFLNGLALQKYPSETIRESLPVIKIREMRQGYSAATDRASSDIDSKYIIEDGDLLFSWSGSLFAKFWTEGRGALNQHLFKVTSKHYPAWFYYLWLQQHMPQFQEIAAGKATTMGHIQRHHLSAAKCLVPPRSLLDLMTELVQPMTRQLVAIEVESKTLARTRESLLPRLMVGDLL